MPDFTIGCDPELGFLDGDRFVSAGSIIRDPGNTEGFGLDGCGRVAELRPAPSHDVYLVVDRLRKLMRQGLRRYPRLQALKWKAGSTANRLSQPIGGHIHFGTHGMLRDDRVPVALRALDRYLAIPALLIESDEEARARRGQYGMLGDYRPQPHGFEYRTPSSWLTSPFVALGVLSLAKAVVSAVVNSRLEVQPHLQTDRRAFEQRDQDYLLGQWRQEVWPTIQKLPMVNQLPSYRDAVSIIHHLIESRRNWFPRCGLKEAWFLDSPSEVTPELPVMTFDAVWRDVPQRAGARRRSAPQAPVAVGGSMPRFGVAGGNVVTAW